ncbi:hypothetical protein IRZ71_15875 [Flavobacterium sp. ANB]|uniref:hypothetical protein n=1 Tax=unclassified Flavobacterium TaxID=196869 RepID=UPI0012B7450D|nr:MULTISPECIES: hypothetical protein [unclassified Flavobacterium]MBF4517844.1 hypothetical protein [Flavobacterium sp. ANB]MTD72086.1 hypothetical protein [Flavobacterium sp. LC2016-13]
MKKIFKILIFLVVVSCARNQDQKKGSVPQKINNDDELSKYDIVEEKETKDTIKNYWSIDLDTIKSSEIVKNDSKDFALNIFNYSLNDSSIVKSVDEDSYHINFDIYHDRISEIVIREGNKKSIKKIDKASFKIKNKEFNQYSVIKYTKFISHKNGELFFISTLNIPDTDWVEEIKFSIQKDNPEKIKLFEKK